MKNVLITIMALAFSSMLSCSRGSSEESSGVNESSQANAFSLIEAVRDQADENLLCSEAIDPFREIAIVSPFVVEDGRANPGGPWHFGTLIKNMLPENATSQEVSDFVVAWLEQWRTVTRVNGYSVPRRDAVRDAVICPWRNASNGGTDCSGELDLDKAPFRLLAIMNRMDLRNPNDCQSAGEGRFVFAVLDNPTTTPFNPQSASPLPFTVILEYGLPTSDTIDAKAWADAWHALGADDRLCHTAEGCEPYRQALESLTTGFSTRNLVSVKPNGNPLNQIRTNEIAMGPSWELREFTLTSLANGVRLRQSTVKQTPDSTLNGTETLKNFILANTAAIPSGTHRLPDRLLGSSSFASFDSERKWAVDGISEELRFNFSKSTCNGCHREESSKISVTGGFYHVSPEGPAGLGRLSDFVLKQDMPQRVANLKKLSCASTCEEKPFSAMSAWGPRTH